MSYFLPLYKADAERRLVFARAAMEEPDKSREIMDYATARPQFEAWSKQYSDATLGKSLGNIRAMHNPRHLAGKVQDIIYDDAGKAVDVCIKVLDPVDWTKVEEGGYTGLSIGGGYVKKWADSGDPTLTRYTPRIAEISLVDSPCIPSARIMELQKSEGETVEVVLKGVPRSFDELKPPATFDEMNKVNLGGVARSFGRGVTRGAKQYGHFVADTTRLGRNVGTVAGYHVGRKLGAHPLSTGPAELGGTIGATAGLQVGLAPAAYVGQKIADKITGRKRKDATKQEPTSALAKGFWENLFGKPKTNLGNPQIDAQHASMQARDRAQALSVRRSEPIDFDNLLEKAKTSPAERDKVHQVMHEFKHGQLRSFRSNLPKRKMPHVTNRRQAIAIALNQARRMGKQDDADILESVLKRDPEPQHDPADHTDRIPVQAQSHGGNIEAIKARWISEAHHDLDDHFSSLLGHASKAVLGQQEKIASVHGQRDNAWRAVGDAQDAYDKVRGHLPPHHSLMMEVPHSGGLLYNPEGVGEDHFHPTGKPKAPIHLLHPLEANDWVGKHSKKKVEKSAPPGLITDIRQLTQRAAAA